MALALAGGYAMRSWTGRNRSPNLEKFHVTKLTDSGKVELAAISGDGRYVCYSLRDREGSGLWLHQLATHSVVQVLPSDASGFEGLTFSPDGNHIYYVRADKNDPGFKYLYVMPVLGGSSRLLIKDNQGYRLPSKFFSGRSAVRIHTGHSTTQFDGCADRQLGWEWRSSAGKD